MKKRARWTILGMKESIIGRVREHASENGFTIARALEDFIVKSDSKKKSKE